MTTLVFFDTHRAIKRLVASGMTEQQAEGAVEVVVNSMSELVTKDELARQLAALKHEMLVQVSAIGAVLAGVSVWFLTHAN